MRRNVTMILTGIVATALLSTLVAFPTDAYGYTTKAAKVNANYRISSTTGYTKAPFNILKKGSTGDSVLLLQEKLALLGMFDKSKYHPKIGDYTVATLIKFQKDFKVSASGTYDKSTATKLDAKVYSYDKMVKPGDKSEIVSIVKRNLITLGFYKGSVDETLNKGLEAALKKYQTAKKLPSTGNIGTMTLKNINWDLAKNSTGVVIAKASATPKAAVKTTVKTSAKKPAAKVAKKSTAPKKATVAKSNSSNAKVSIVAYAKTFLKYRYVYGGASSRGYDCSGLMMSIMRKYGINLPHNSVAQSRTGKKVSLSQLQPGDLLFFGRGSAKIGHVGIYLGNDTFLHASSPSSGIKIDRVSTYHKKVVVARRYPIHTASNK